MHIRDPIHGAIEVSRAERALLDHRAFQRLRTIKQLGFSDVAYPGATHTRFAHVVGAMHVGTRIFDSVFGQETALPAALRARFRQALRLAVLCHDLGHPPLSHTSELALPQRAELGLPEWATGDPEGRATHEDCTRWLLLEGDLADRIRATFDGAPSVEEIVYLLGADPPSAEGAFVHGSIDYGPLLRQVVASELDADRMDYLRRDALFAGVSYGTFDLEWILSNLCLTRRAGAAYLTLDRRAIFAFEDFLLSRYHMFIAVYFHRASVAYDEMLRRFYRQAKAPYRIPSRRDAFLTTDDIDLYSALRASDDEWARRIVRRQGYRTVYEEHPGDPPHAAAVREALEAAGIPLIESESESTVSRYLEGPMDLFVRTADGEVPIDHYSALFERYAEAATMRRLYVPPERTREARAVVAATLPRDT